MNYSVFFCCSLLMFSICNGNSGVSPEFYQPAPSHEEIVFQAPADSGSVLETRFPPPRGYKRTVVATGSYANYLRRLPLKNFQAKVHLFNGRPKSRQNVHAAVVDLDVGSRDLQQCADAVIRLRAEYFYHKGDYGNIRFSFTNGFPADYEKWRQGNRITVEGNNVYWRSTNATESTSYKSFRKYLDMVFAYAGTYSLLKDMKKVPLEDIRPGDAFVQAGSPGHAVIVVDVAEHELSGEKIFMLAQSYMPAQDIHVLVNPENEDFSPWYSLRFGDVLHTPEWSFDKKDLRRFE